MISAGSPTRARVRCAFPRPKLANALPHPYLFRSQPTLDRFLELAEFQKNWDQRGSAQVRHDVLSFALRSVLPKILPPTAPAPAVIPLGHGGIQLILEHQHCGS